MLIFEADSCALIRSIEVFGKGVGQISTIAALRFTPDGKHIAIVDDFSNGVLFFSLNGEYVSCIDGGDSGDSLGALDCPMDADFALNGDIVIADGENHRVCVFSPSGNLRHHFGSYGEDPGCFMTPSALAVHGNTLYVVEWGSGRVQVFS